MECDSIAHRQVASTVFVTMGCLSACFPTTYIHNAVSVFLKYNMSVVVNKKNVEQEGKGRVLPDSLLFCSFKKKKKLK